MGPVLRSSVKNHTLSPSLFRGIASKEQSIDMRASFAPRSNAIVQWVNSPTGPKTTHFWGPVANWGFVLAGLADMQKPPEYISPNMTATMCVYSVLFMRFAWVVKPRNYLLLGCHMCNETVQLFQLSRWYDWYRKQPAGTTINTSTAH